MTHDTATEDGRKRRLFELADGYVRTGNWYALVRLAGLSNSDRDVSEADAGEPPKGAQW